MGNRQELSKLNEEIELLESAGLIKAASVLHKKFIKESQAAPQTGPQSYMTNAGIEVIKPGQTPPPAPAPVAPPPTAPPPSPFNNYYQDPTTGKIIFVDPRTGRPFENGQGLPSDLGQGGNFTPPPGFTVTPAPTPVPPPAPNPFPTPGGNSDIPYLRERFNFYYGQINNGFNIGDSQQQQAYFDRVKRQIFDQLQKGLIDQKTYNDLMKLFAR